MAREPKSFCEIGGINPALQDGHMEGGIYPAISFVDHLGRSYTSPPIFRITHSAVMSATNNARNPQCADSRESVIGVGKQTELPCHRLLMRRAWNVIGE